MRLNDCIIRYDGKPFHVLADGMSIVLHSIANGTPIEKVLANSSRLDVSSVEVGYVNFQIPKFISRAPYRRQKQGIASDNLLYREHNHNDSDLVRRDWMFTQEFSDMLNGVYPSYEACMIDSRKTLAFSRSFLIDKFKENTKLYHNEVLIGIKPRTSPLFRLEEHANHSVMAMKLTTYGVPLDQG